MTINHFKPNKSFIWIIIILMIQLIFCFLFSKMDAAYHPDKMGSYNILHVNDYAELLQPVDHYFISGTYEKNLGSNVSYAGRLPGYSFIYLLLRLVLPQPLALLSLVLLQIILFSIATYCIGVMLHKITKNNAVFFLSITFISFLAYFNPWHRLTVPESFSVSAFIFALFYIHNYFSSLKTSHLLLCGFFLTWTFFLRGFLLPYILIFGAILCIHLFKNNRKNILSILKSLALFSLPFFILEGAWITRNYLSLHQFIPLQTTFAPGTSNLSEYHLDSPYKGSILELRTFIASWGGNNVHYYPNSEISYFLTSSIPENYFPFPSHLFEETFTKNEFTELRNLVQSSFDQSKTFEARMEIENKIIEQTNTLKKRYISTHPFYHYIIAPLKRIKNLLFFNVVSDWPGPSFANSSLMYKTLKLLCLGFYLLNLILAPFSIIFTFFSKNKMQWIVLLCLLSLLFTFGFLVNVAEYKYFFTGFMAVFFLNTILITHIYFRFAKNSLK